MKLKINKILSIIGLIIQTINLVNHSVFAPLWQECFPFL